MEMLAHCLNLARWRRQSLCGAAAAERGQASEPSRRTPLQLQRSPEAAKSSQGRYRRTGAWVGCAQGARGGAKTGGTAGRCRRASTGQQRHQTGAAALLSRPPAAAARYGRSGRARGAGCPLGQACCNVAGRALIIECDGRHGRVWEGGRRGTGREPEGHAAPNERPSTACQGASDAGLQCGPSGAW